jgi:hypothetical protein
MNRLGFGGCKAGSAKAAMRRYVLRDVERAETIMASYTGGGAK